MTGVPITQAGLQAPLLAFVPDDDVFPFENLGHLLGKSIWWVDQNRHVGVEIVDSAERRWAISGLVQAEPPKRRWWQFGRSPEPEWEIEVQALDAESFVETRRRVELQANQIFDESDDALAAIRTAATMADLSRACFEITMRAQGLRILAGRSDIPIRSSSTVAQRAVVLFAVISVALKMDRMKVVEWLNTNDLIGAISPSDADLLGSRRWTDEQRADALWSIESLVALLWALKLADMPSGDDFADIDVIAEIVPPGAALPLHSFLASAQLRSGEELASMAEECRRQSRSAAEEAAGQGSEDRENAADAAWRRCGAIQWILNPDRLEWE